MFIFLIPILIYILLLELVTVHVYGKWITDRQYLDAVEFIMKNGEPNCYDNNIIAVPFSTSMAMGDGRFSTCFISKLPLSVFCRYRLSGIGSIPRWTRMHKIIKQGYANR